MHLEGFDGQGIFENMKYDGSPDADADGDFVWVSEAEGEGGDIPQSSTIKTKGEGFKNGKHQSAQIKVQC